MHLAFCCHLNFCSRDLGAEHFAHMFATCVFFFKLRYLFTVIGKNLLHVLELSPLSFTSLTDIFPHLMALIFWGNRLLSLKCF